jgi:hypothetical protein
LYIILRSVVCIRRSDVLIILSTSSAPGRGPSPAASSSAAPGRGRGRGQAPQLRTQEGRQDSSARARLRRRPPPLSMRPLSALPARPSSLHLPLRRGRRACGTASGGRCRAVQQHWAERRSGRRKEERERADGWARFLQGQRSHFMCCGVLETKIKEWSVLCTISKSGVCCAQNHHLGMCHRPISQTKIICQVPKENTWQS